MSEEATEQTGSARRPTRAQRVYGEIRDLILSGALPAGAFAREQDLSDRLGVSRTPIREALARLASEGFLERLPRRGFRVPEESFAGMIESYPVISALELLAGRLAFPRARASDLKTLRTLNRRLTAAIRAGDVECCMEINDEFHDFIAALSANGRLRELLNELKRPMRRLETWYYSDRARGEQSVREHEALIAALESGEMERALAIFEGNMALTTKALVQERTALRARTRSSRGRG